MNTIFHEGELAVQERAGVQTMAARVGNSIKSTIPPIAAQFLAERPFAILGSIDGEERVWASLLTGGSQFINPIDERMVQINPHVEDADPLWQNLQQNRDIGLLAIDLAARQRMRLNGKASWHLDELIIEAEQVYANCPKYIQERLLTQQVTMRAASQSERTNQLSPEQEAWIAEADTFFIATANPAGGVDASHRGGNQGFIHVDNAQQLTWPDYAGNMMFNTLGNIAINPHAGLLFVDFENGRLLQITGKAEIIWEETRSAQFAGAERLVTFTIDQLIETQPTQSLQWMFGSYSPYNPR